MKLYENGVYLVNGTELVEDGALAAEAIAAKTAAPVQKNRRRKIPSLTAF